MSDTFLINIQGGASFEILRGETILSAFIRRGVPLTSPCGGRGICGKCRLTLIEGIVRLNDTGDDVKSGTSFPACRAQALSDITVFLQEEENSGEPLAVIQAGRKIQRAGIALDIGTTTLQAELICLDTGESLETFSAFNNQRSFGADVMSRISAARNGKLSELSAAINHQIDELLRQYIDKWNIKTIEQCTVSANTTMLHLFSGVDPSAMGEVPFTPAFLEERHFTGEELSLPVEHITLLPGISAFVGADIVSGLAFIDIMNKKEISFFVDIGTNGEIAVWNNREKHLFCCSTAAGPCFEGAEISCGMGAVNGAINRISFKEDTGKWFRFGRLFYTTLGNAKAHGVCGAGFIDAIAVMKKLGAIDETGALADEYAAEGFPLAEGIFITQKDVRQFQLAKSAVYSGIKILCKNAGIEFENIKTAYIAGGLGFFIDMENASQTGLLPGVLAEKAAVCGNTSLKGAVKSLTDPSFLPRCREIISHSSTVEIAMDSDFADEFADNMWI